MTICCTIVRTPVRTPPPLCAKGKCTEIRERERERERTKRKARWGQKTTKMSKRKRKKKP